MPPPPNDEPANAEVLTGPYWGVAAGTTIDATESSAFSDWGSQDVWYHWNYLPPGNVYIFIKPRPPYNPSNFYIEGNLFAKTPTTVTGDEDNDEWIAWGANSDWWSERGMFQGLHPGGPLTLVVLTYTPEGYEFDLGWGHELDANPAHWESTPRTSSWHTFNVYPSTTDRMRESHVIAERGPAPGTPPANQSLVDCLYENAVRGVVADTSSGCFPLPSGPGRQNNEPLADIGYLYHASSRNTGFPFSGGDYYRGDYVEVYEQLVIWDMGPTGSHHGPIPPDRKPDDWYTITDPTTPGNEENNEFNWGWKYESPNWETGEMRTSFNFRSASELAPDPTVALVHLPQSVIQAPEDYDWTAPDQVTYGRPYTSPDWMGDIEYTFQVIDDLPSPIAEFPPPYGSGATRTFPNWGDLIQDEPDGSEGRFIFMMFTTTDVIEHVIPPALDLPYNFFAFSVGASVSCSANLEVVGSGLPYDAEYRQPAWRMYRGFPLVAPPVGAWHVGRIATGAW